MPKMQVIFSRVGIGEYFVLPKGLLWRKISPTQAIDVWSGRIVTINPEVTCSMQTEQKGINHEN